MLFVITLGFYGWYWVYRTHREARRQTGQGLGGVLGLLLWILLLPVSAFVIPSEVRRMYEKAGREAPVSGRTGLWLFPFGVLIVPAIVWFVKIHRALDRLDVPRAPADRRLGGARERTLIARWGRFVTRNHKPVFVVLSSPGPARDELGARPARRLRPGHAADRPDRAAGVRPARGGLRPRLQRTDPDRGRRER